jgi:hypothetical protein
VPTPARADLPDLQEASDRNRHARHIVTGFSRATPALADLWQQIEHSLSDTPILIAEITRLRSELTTVRLDWANLAAAGRATLAAYHDGEPDPLSYLRDELDAQGFGTQRRPA